MRNEIVYKVHATHWATGAVTTEEWSLRMPRKTTTFAIYDTARVYGGPEEGGWWYVKGFRVGELVTINPKKKGAFRKLKMLTERASRYIPEGEDVSIQEYHGEFFPKERPYYC